MNEPLGRLGSFRPGSGTADGLGHRPDGVLLADDPLVQLVLHPQELGRLLLGELVDGDAGPVGQHLGDDLLVDDVEQVDALGAPLLLLGRLALEEILLLLPELLGRLEVLLLDGDFLVLADPDDLLFDGLVVRRRGHAADAQPAAGLVDEVDGLVRQVAVGDVAVGQVGGGDHGLVGDRHAVVRLVAVAQALQDLDGVAEGRLVDLDRLETALQGGVLLQVLAVLVEGGGADGLQLAAGQHRLQDRRRVDGPLGRAGTDERVQLVDEEDDVAPGADLLEHLLQALLEVTAVAGPGDQRPEVQGVELLALDRLGNVVGDDLLGQPLDDGRLADAGLADEHRVVLGAARQHLHDPLDLALPADDRVELAFSGQLGEVAPELVEHGRAARGLGRRGGAGARSRAFLGPARRVAGEQLDDLLADPGQVGAQADEDLGGHALALSHQAEQHVLGADVVVAQLQGLAQRQLEDLLGPGGERRRTRGRRAGGADGLLDLLADAFQADAERLEGFGGDALTLVDEAEQDVLGADEVVVEEPRFLLGENQDSSGSVSETFEQGDLPPQRLETSGTHLGDPTVPPTSLLRVS